jgi:hypothetical protein
LHNSKTTREREKTNRESRMPTHAHIHTERVQKEHTYIENTSPTKKREREKRREERETHTHKHTHTHTHSQTKRGERSNLSNVEIDKERSTCTTSSIVEQETTHRALSRIGCAHHNNTRTLTGGSGRSLFTQLLQGLVCVQIELVGCLLRQIRVTNSSYLCVCVCVV